MYIRELGGTYPTYVSPRSYRKSSYAELREQGVTGTYARSYRDLRGNMRGQYLKTAHPARQVFCNFASEFASFMTQRLHVLL